MQPMTVVRIMPVIQKVIMKQRSPYQHLSIHGKMQKLRYSTTVFRNSDAVIKNRHIAVLDIIFIFFNWPFLHQSRQMLNNLFFVPAHTYHSLISIAIFSILTHPFNSHHIFLLSIFKYLCRCHLL
jgi:hypothetical protein